MLSMRKIILGLLLAGLVITSGVVWFRFAYPKFSVINLSVTRSQALDIARKYVSSVNLIDLSDYRHAIVFEADSNVDLYLQKSLGINQAEQFLGRHQFDMYFWTVRFFKENQKEEYQVSVSSGSGEVISYLHLLDDATARAAIDEDIAKEKAKQFLQKTFNYDFNDWVFHAEQKSKFDHRIEHKFKWEKKNVYVPWDKDLNQGGGKFLTIVTISGQEIQSFVKQSFLVPEQFDRYIERRKESGRNLSLIASVGSIALFLGAIFIMLVRKNHLCMNATKFFYIYTFAGILLLTLVSSFNNAQGYLFSFPTTQPFFAYFFRQGVYEFIDRFFSLGCLIIPALAGELLRFENFPKKPWMGIFNHMATSFFTRNTSKSIFFGYCFAVLMFGVQTFIFEFGFKYFDVWVQQEHLSFYSTAYFPFLSVLLVAASAAITEETFYRLFGVNLTYNLMKNKIIAFLLPSIIWGLGHTGYMVLPFWFRGLEVAILGIFTCFVYYRFGLVTVIVQHYLFDAFWGGSVYLFAKSTGINFWMSITILLIPALFALIAFSINKIVLNPEIMWKLNKQQNYNLNILKTYIRHRQHDINLNADSLRSELINNGWDIAVVDMAFAQLNLPYSSFGKL